MNLRKLRWLTSAFVKRHRRASAFGVLLTAGLALGIRYSATASWEVSLLNLASEVKYSEGLVGLPQTLNPLFVNTDTERDLSSLIFRGLTKSSVTGDSTGDIAENWEISSTGQTYLFHLKPGQKFQNGDSLTAEDVAFTYQLAKNPATGSKLAETFKNLEVQVVGDNSVLFRLSDPFSPFLSLTDLGILPRKLLEKLNPSDLRVSKFNLLPVGSSDFRLKSLTSDGAVFTRSGATYIFRFYKNSSDLRVALKLGEIRSAGFTDHQGFEDWKNLQTLSSPLYQRFVGVFYNLRGGSTQDRTLRQGLSYALSRTEIIQNVLQGAGESAYGPIPPASWAKSESPRRYDFNLDSSKSGLERAGWTGGPIRQKDGKPLEIALSYQDTPIFRKLAESVAKQWGEVGVRALLNPLSPADFRTRVVIGKDFQAALLTQEVGSDPDQYVLWHTTQESGSNISGLKLPKLDKALEDGRHLQSRDERSAKYLDFQRFILEEEPVSFLYYPKYSFVVSTKIQGLDLRPLGVPKDRLQGITDWKIGRSFF